MLGKSRCPAAPGATFMVAGAGATRLRQSSGPDNGVDGGRPVPAWPQDSKEGPWTLP